MGNPLVLFFMILALVLLALTVGLVLYQRRVFEQQKRQVQDLLAEARRLADEEQDARLREGE